MKKQLNDLQTYELVKKIAVDDAHDMIQAGVESPSANDFRIIELYEAYSRKYDFSKITLSDNYLTDLYKIEFEHYVDNYNQ
jgi:hypothetical protein